MDRCFLTNTTLNIESFMGIIVMVGIVVSNSILLVDFANQESRSGEPLRAAVVDSARIRMRPILMTALATIVGLMPIALGWARAPRPGAAGARGGRRPGGVDRLHPGAGAHGVRGVLFTARGGGGPMRRSDTMKRAA